MSDLYSISGSIAPTRVSWAYRAGLVVVTLAMLALPLVYLALIGLAGYAVVWHVTANAWIMSSTGPSQWKALEYFGPAVAGCVLVFFLVKPIFARPARRVDPVEIQPEAEPEIFRFVTRICEEVRAPVPSRIQVNCQVNAAASFSSMLALLRPRFVLTIGLPLAGGLTIRQLGGVLAHEFGHFAQGGGMRLTFIVRTINAWFARVVFERDRWDEALDRHAKESDWRFSLILNLAKGSVWCSRRVLYGLMVAGHAISCFMMRQMEYDADSYEIKFAGSAAFLETSARMRELNVGAQIGYHDLQESWARRTLPSNLPALLLNGCSRVPEELAHQLRQVPDAATGWFDTHPADADRARAAEQARDAGVVDGGDVPAAMLFRDFEALSTAATRHHYEHDLSLNLDSLTLIDTRVAVAATLSRQKSYESARAFFGEQVSAIRPVRAALDGIESLTVPELIAKLLETRREMSADADKGAAAYREHEEIDRKLTLARTASAIFDAGFTKVVAADFGLGQGNKDGAAETLAIVDAELRRQEPVVQRLDDLAATRLACGLALLDRMPLDFDPEAGDAMRRDAARLTPTLHALADAWPHVQEIRRLLVVARIFAQNGAASPDPAAFNAKFTAIVDRIRMLLGRIRTAAANAPDDDPDRPVPLVTRLGIDSTADTEQRAPAAVNAAVSLRADVLGRLCAVALQVEAEIDRRGVTSPSPSSTHGVR